MPPAHSVNVRGKFIWSTLIANYYPPSTKHHRYIAEARIDYHSIRQVRMFPTKALLARVLKFIGARFEDVPHPYAQHLLHQAKEQQQKVSLRA